MKIQSSQDYGFDTICERCNEKFVSEAELSLPLEGLPLPLCCRPYIYETSAKITGVLSLVSERLIQDNVEFAANNSFRKYTAHFNRNLCGRVYQISIITSTLNFETVISFEEKSHAIQKNAELAAIFRRIGQDKLAENVVLSQFNCSPVDFLHSHFYRYNHSELCPLKGIDLTSDEERLPVEAWLERVLLNVVNHLIAGDAFAILPKEDVVWIGISSPSDWYDHVRRIYRISQACQQVIFE